MPPLFDFGTAIAALKRGDRVTRFGWNGPGQWLQLYRPDQLDYLPFVRLSTVQGKRVPWTPSQTDVLAEDWIIMDGTDEA
jgi:hypothetical protein